MQLKKIKIILALFIFNYSFAQVKLSFENGSSEEFKFLKVKHIKEYYFENLKPGQSTLQISLDGTFQYLPMVVITEKDTLGFKPMDFYGAKYHETGNLTMSITIIGKYPKRTINIILKE